MDVLKYPDYKAFLKVRLARGSQKRFAEFLGCQPAFLSQVLRSKPHLSLEQGVLATDYFQMNKPESEYFILALQLGRAGSTRLKSFFRSQMDRLIEDHQRIDSKIENYEKLDDIAKATFYSSWKFAMVHVLMAIPATNQIDFIREKTRLSEKEVFNIIEFLKKIGLIERRSGRWITTKRRIHLSPEESLIDTHHKNFRSLTLNELEDSKRDSLHYSSAMALSKEDIAKIKSILLEAIAKTESVLTPSPEEAIRVFCVDFYEPGH
jgi:uncharacterized protein (TIGR02147 family)